MIETIALAGPASPRDLAHLFTGETKKRALAIPGYRGVMVNELAEALLEGGFRVHVVTAAQDVETTTVLEHDRLTLTAVPMRSRARDRALSLFREERRHLTAAIRGSDADVVNAHWTYEFAWAALDSGRATVVTAHDAPLTILRYMPDAYRLLRAFMAYRVRLGTRSLIAGSPYLASQWRRQMLYRRPIAVIPNVAPSFRGAGPAPNGHGPLVVSVADSGARKNVRTLVEAFSRVRSGDARVELALVGEGLGDDDPFANEIRRSGLAEGIRFCGRLERDSLARVLQEARVFATTSYEECCPMSVLEAMRMGLPVVAGRSAGGTPWVLGDGAAALLVDVRNPEDVAGAIRRLLDDRSLASRLAAAGTSLIEERYTRAAVALRTLEHYEQTLSAIRGRNGRP